MGLYSFPLCPHDMLLKAHARLKEREFEKEEYAKGYVLPAVITFSWSHSKSPHGKDKGSCGDVGQGDDSRTDVQSSTQQGISLSHDS